MDIIKLSENENLQNAEFALSQATSDNIIERCRSYLLLLFLYREELYKLRGTPEINLYQSHPLARELVEQTRKSIRTAIQTITLKRNQTESLLKSFTSISGYQAVNTFNQLKYRSSNEWEMRSNVVRIKTDDNNKKITIEQAVEIASQLRRDAYLANKTVFF
jgi:hypothetical protein